MVTSLRAAFSVSLPVFGSAPASPPHSRRRPAMRASAAGSQKPLSFDPTVYFVADAGVGAGRDLNAIAASAVSGGVRAVQFRDKTGDDGLEPRAEALRDVVRAASSDAVFIVNDDPILAKKLGADGVHVGQKDAALSEARSVVGDDGIVGVSVGTAEEAEAAIVGGADYIGVGPVFGTTSKPDAREPLGLGQLAVIVRVVDKRLPIVAIGGVNMANCGGCAVTGVDGVAVIAAIVKSGDPEREVKEMYERFESVHFEREAGGKPPKPVVLDLEATATTAD